MKKETKQELKKWLKDESKSLGSSLGIMPEFKNKFIWWSLFNKKKLLKLKTEREKGKTWKASFETITKRHQNEH